MRLKDKQIFGYLKKKQLFNAKFDSRNEKTAAKSMRFYQGVSKVLIWQAVLLGNIKYR